MKHILLSLSLLSAACTQIAPYTVASDLSPADIAGVWCSLDSQGANSECLSIWGERSDSQIDPVYHYTWSDSLEDETESGQLANTPNALTFRPSFETFCYFGPQAGESGHFTRSNSRCIRDYSAQGSFGDGTLTLQFATDSVTLEQFE